MASLDDCMAVLQNLVIAVNGVQHRFFDVEGARTMNAISSATLVRPGEGRICRISVTTAGTSAGSAYDAQSVSLATSASLIATIPNTVGVYEIKMPVLNGLVITPGSGQVVSVSYS